jgi:hypothetical protein
VDRFFGYPSDPPCEDCGAPAGIACTIDCPSGSWRPDLDGSPRPHITFHEAAMAELQTAGPGTAHDLPGEHTDRTAR